MYKDGSRPKATADLSVAPVVDPDTFTVASADDNSTSDGSASLLTSTPVGLIGQVQAGCSCWAGLSG